MLVTSSVLCGFEVADVQRGSESVGALLARGMLRAGCGWGDGHLTSSSPLLKKLSTPHDLLPRRSPWHRRTILPSPSPSRGPRAPSHHSLRVGVRCSGFWLRLPGTLRKSLDQIHVYKEHGESVLALCDFTEAHSLPASRLQLPHLWNGGDEPCSASLPRELQKCPLSGK